MTTPRQRMLDIVDQVAWWHGVKVEDIMGRSRLRRFVIPRRDAVCAIVRNWPAKSYPEVGRFFGLDHSTIQFHLIATGEHKPRMRNRYYKANKFLIWREAHGAQPAPMQAAE